MMIQFCKCKGLVCWHMCQMLTKQDSPPPFWCQPLMTIYNVNCQDKKEKKKRKTKDQRLVPNACQAKQPSSLLVSTTYDHLQCELSRRKKRKKTKTNEMCQMLTKQGSPPPCWCQLLMTAMQVVFFESVFLKVYFEVYFKKCIFWRFIIHIPAIHKPARLIVRSCFWICF